MELILGTDTPVFAIGLLSGAVLLFSGLSVGLWLGRRTPPTYESNGLPDYQVASMLQGLVRWTNGFASDVSQYREEVDRFGEGFQSVRRKTGQDQQDAILGLLSQVVQANDVVKQRLEKAEGTLQQQSEEIAVYVSEARTDKLTGLSNRRAFDDELARRFAEWRKSARTVSVVMFDIDHFKRFNDQHGHQAGDAVLEQVSRVLRETLHESDMIARFGGEEFAAVLPGCDATGAAQAAERVRAAIEEAQFSYENQRLHVTISCGAAQARRGEVVTSLIKRADLALYASKNAGRNCAHWHDGQRNVPVARCTAAQVVPESTTEPDRPTLADQADFREVCDELRQRMHAVVEQEA